LKSEQFFKIYYFILNNFFHQITNYWNVHLQSALRWTTDLLGRPTEASASGVAAAVDAASDVQGHGEPWAVRVQALLFYFFVGPAVCFRNEMQM
jgi:hypothetical protein